MRTLKGVYIKVNKSNHQWLSELFDSSSLELNTYIDFYAEDYRCKYYNGFVPKGKQKVSLSELKRLIDTIPTREEITRLKRQISAYKTNYDKVVKHSLSKEDVIEELTADNERLKNIILTLKQTNNYLYDKKDMLLKENAQLKQRKWYQFW